MFDVRVRFPKTRLSRTKALILLAVAAAALLLALLPALASAQTYSADELTFIQLINNYRQSEGLSTLLLSDAISDAATKHSSDMAKYNFFSHYSVQSAYFPVGSSPWDRMRLCGYPYNTDMGENIAAGDATAQAVFEAWKSSPGHNANMLDPNYKVIGIGLVTGGSYGYYWTTDFGGYVDPTAHDPRSLSPASLPASIAATTRLLCGCDRYETAVDISRQGFPAGAQAVVLTTGENYPDGLAAAPLAKAYGGPILLTPTTGVTPEVAAELQRLNPSQVFLVGLSSSTVGAQVRTLLGQATITPLTGSDRYATAALVADQLKTKLGTITQVVVVPGDSYADGLAAAPLAAAKGWPILLTPQSQPLPPVTSQELSKLGVTSALEVGTQAPIDLPNVVREVGADRYETCALVAKYAIAQGLSFSHTALASGNDFPDALAAGPYLALDGGILLLTADEMIPPPISSLLSANAGKIQTLDFLALPALAGQMGGGA